jgi:hypothetical protein
VDWQGVERVAASGSGSAAGLRFLKSPRRLSMF